MVTDHFLEQFDMHCELLVCIYTCERHGDFLDAFYRSAPGQFLQQLRGATLLEVYADPNALQSFRDGNRLVVRSPESYETLSLKTLEMIRYCTSHFDFDRLLKIDVTTMRTRFEGREYEGRLPIDLVELTRFLENLPPHGDYGGFLLHKNASRQAATRWAQKKGRSIDFERLFGAGPLPPFYSGKCYYISRAFAEYISAKGDLIAQEHVEHFIGAEDVMVARLFEKFSEYRDR